MGVGFGYPFVKLLFGIKIYSYTHYPIVSLDMVKNNTGEGVSIKKTVKQTYYHILIMFYKLCGYFANEVAANSSWTKGHMDSLWNKGEHMELIYPPCDTSEFINNIKNDVPRKN